jgi:hypothetical protein
LPKDDFELGEIDPDAEPGGRARGMGAGEAPPRPLRLVDDDFAEPLSALADRAGGDSERRPSARTDAAGQDSRGGPRPGGDSGKSGLMRSDSEENLYVLLDDKPEPPSRPAFVPPPPPEAPPIDADAPLGETAPEAPRDPSADLGEAALLDAAGGAPVAPPESPERPLEVDEKPQGARGESLVEEDREEEPEFLYPKESVSARFKLPEPARKPPNRALRAATTVAGAVILGVAATLVVKAFLSPPPGAPAPAASSAPPAAVSPAEKPAERPPRVVPPGDPIGAKIHRALAWGLPLDRPAAAAGKEKRP